MMGREVVRTLVVPNLRIYAEHLLEPALNEGDLAQRDDAEKVLEAIMVLFLFRGEISLTLEIVGCVGYGGGGFDGG